MNDVPTATPVTPLYQDRSDSINELAKALAECQKNIPTVKKSGKNPHFNSKYATLDDIIEAIRKPMADAGLSYMQLPLENGGMQTIVMHQSGQWMRSTIRLQARDQSPQALGSVITYMRRYAISSMLGVASEEDDDGNEASKPGSAAPARTASKAPVKKTEEKVKPIDSARNLIEEAKTVDTLLMIRDRVEKSKDFTEKEKAELTKNISAKVDRLDSGTPTVDAEA